MKKLLTLALAAAAAASAHADLIDAKFAGLVLSQAGTSFAINAPISGEFVFDTSTNSYRSFVIGGLSVAAGFASSAFISLDKYSALYEAQLSPVATGGNLNSSFALDLEGLNTWSAASAAALLTDSAQLAANLSLGAAADFPSSFSYYTAAADGTNIHRVTATLASLSVSAVPEVSSASLLALGLVALALRRTARRTP